MSPRPSRSSSRSATRPRQPFSSPAGTPRASGWSTGTYPLPGLITAQQPGASRPRAAVLDGGVVTQGCDLGLRRQRRRVFTLFGVLDHTFRRPGRLGCGSYGGTPGRQCRVASVCPGKLHVLSAGCAKGRSSRSHSNIQCDRRLDVAARTPASNPGRSTRLPGLGREEAAGPWPRRAAQERVWVSCGHQVWFSGSWMGAGLSASWVRGGEERRSWGRSS